MIYVSMIEIMVKARTALVGFYDLRLGSWLTVGGFFLGILVMAVIDKLVPEAENPHEAHTVEEMDGTSEVHKAKLMRMGMFTALALGIHNFPEGSGNFLIRTDGPHFRGFSGHRDRHPQHP
jgi:zinc transporter, ZIP family